MNTVEALKITRFVQSACPAQKFEENTPDVWVQLLADVRFEDARAACVELGKRLTFIGPPEIRAEVRRQRAERIKRDMSEPVYDGDDVLAGLRAIRAHRAAQGDGTAPPRRLEAGVSFKDVKGLMKEHEQSTWKMPPMPHEGEQSA